MGAIFVEKDKVLYDKDGDQIDLEVIYGVYPDRARLLRFFHQFTKYTDDEIPGIVDYIIENIHPNDYDLKKRREMQNQIEEAFGIKPLNVSAGSGRDGMVMIAWIIGAIYCVYGVFRIVTFNPANINSFAALISGAAGVLMIPCVVLAWIATILAFVGWLKSYSGPTLASAIVFTLATLSALVLAFWVLLPATILSYIGYSNLKKA